MGGGDPITFLIALPLILVVAGLYAGVVYGACAGIDQLDASMQEKRERVESAASAIIRAAETSPIDEGLRKELLRLGALPGGKNVIVVTDADPNLSGLATRGVGAVIEIKSSGPTLVDLESIESQARLAMSADVRVVRTGDGASIEQTMLLS